MKTDSLTRMSQISMTSPYRCTYLIKFRIELSLTFLSKNESDSHTRQ